MYTSIIELNNMSDFFDTNLNLKQELFFFNDYSYFLFLLNYSDFNFLPFNGPETEYAKSLITFINQTEDISFFQNLENVQTIYHYSIPTTKLAYPEPFIASASFMHSDLWFVHILIYQYWLWFAFIFIIVFFFITFICTVRWCNMRVRPRRETRGVSRSKCGDLLTATVPVSWAMSIIINESTDAIDYYDGFGTTELVIGIRAYQWGWEYYYPKDLDLNYNVKHNYSSFIGNSLKYNTASDLNLKANNFWKFYQNKPLDSSITPAHLLLLPLDNYKILNFLNFNDIGTSGINESAAFKRIRMYSKTFTTNLTPSSGSFSYKYKNLNALYTDDSLFSDSYLYGLKRQHNFLSNKATAGNFSTFFNLKNVDKLINYNFSTKANLLKTFDGYFFFNFFSRVQGNHYLFETLRVSNLFNSYSQNFNLFYWNKLNLYPNLFDVINNDTDRKKIHHPLYKLFNLPYKKIKLNNLAQIKTSNFFLNNDFTNNQTLNAIFNNNDLTYKTYTPFSSNQAIPTTSRSVRKFINTSPNLSNFNYSTSLNTLNSYLNAIPVTPTKSSYYFHNLSSFKWLDLDIFNKLSSNRIYFDSPYSPIISNYPTPSLLNFDDCKRVFTEDTPISLQGKEELTPAFVTNVYWNFYWAHSSTDWRVFNNLKYNKVHNNFYLPIFSLYYDYDFRNWQSFELLEDSYWESTLSLYSFDEYATLASDFYKYEFFDKYEEHFNINHKLLKFKDSVLYKPFFKNLNSTGEFYSNAFYIEDAVLTPSLLSGFNFSIFPVTNVLNSLDDSYESLKYISHIFNLNSKVLLNAGLNFFTPHTYSYVFDMFRADYDEFSWFFDEKNTFQNFYFNYVNSLLNFTWFYDCWNIWYNLPLTVEQLAPLSFFKTSNSPIYSSISSPFDLSTDDFNNELPLRFSNNFTLRSSIRNSIVTYNAIQKVFRSRFDENRSHSKLTDFSNSFTTQPFISMPRVHYENLLGKTKESFFKINLYKPSFKNSFNSLYSSFSSINFSFFDFPFLMALKSDASRYLWLDWYAKWGFYEVQPSSASRYAIHGMPYFNKSFDFNAPANEALTETENYMTRLSRARRNYLPNWVYTPYFYAKNNLFYKNNILWSSLTHEVNNVTSLLSTLDIASWYWTTSVFTDFNNKQFAPSNSNLNSYGRASWRPVSSVQAYYFTISTLVDTLTKREFLYRELLSSTNKVISLPLYLTNSPSNPLINEIKAAFLLIDPIVYNNEYSRDVYYSSLTFYNFNILKTLLNDFSDTLNVRPITNYLFFYLLNGVSDSTLGQNSDLLRTQFRPLRKGISNMIRLHATGAIAMPTEIRLQILASSKDVIHSWAVPSAGVKIDCVPGYSSHRVLIFLVSGIFWGQCMEICGRYHHWMPIVVYFMKRDLFFLWCTHFVYLSGANNMWTINDRQYTDYVRVVSFDKSSWVSELAY